MLVQVGLHLQSCVHFLHWLRLNREGGQRFGGHARLSAQVGLSDTLSWTVCMFLGFEPFFECRQLRLNSHGVLKSTSHANRSYRNKLISRHFWAHPKNEGPIRRNAKKGRFSIFI